MSVLRLAAACLAVVIITACATIPEPASAEVRVGASFDFFYSNLGPHGQWIVSGSYGRVWQPAVYRVGWNPYYDGHWVYTDVGWAWVSDYEWGAIPYHYGTWVMDADIGWCWVPGYVWAPSWVVFRTGPDYIGWAPVPVRYSVGMSVVSRSYDPGAFVFVASRDFLAPRVRGYAVPANGTSVVINNTRIENTIRIENNIVVNSGPDVDIVQRASGKRIQAESIERVARVGPARRMSREDLRVDASRDGASLRAAEPISREQSERIIERGRGRTHGPNSQEAQDRETRRDAPQGREDQGRGRRFSPSADPQMQPPDEDRDRDLDRERQRGRHAPEPEATPAQRGRRFSPSADPQMQPPDADARPQEGADRERGPDRAREKQEALEDRQRRRDQTAAPPDDARAKADAEARAQADAKEKADAKAKAKAERKQKKQRPKPTPSGENPPQ